MNLSPACLIVMLTGGQITLTFTADRLKKGEDGRAEGFVITAELSWQNEDKVFKFDWFSQI